MTAFGRRTDTISATTPLSAPWFWLVDEARPYATDIDPARLYQLDLANRVYDPDLADLIEGPFVYAALGPDAWEYVGMTGRPIIERLNGHATSKDAPAKAIWKGLVTIALVPSTPAREVRRLERLGKEYLRPRTGQRWSR